LANESVEIVRTSHKEVELLNVYGKSQKSLNKYYNASEVLLLTSLYEGSPNVIKEAMACNISIVSTNVGDVKEIIGKTEGCYIASFDPKDMAEKIKMALNFNQRTNGRINIQHLEINKIARKIITVYKSVLEKQI